MIKKLFIAAAISAVAIFALAGSAAAYTAEVSPAGAITSPSLGTVTFASGSTTIICNLTLGGTLNSSVTLEAGESLGTLAPGSSRITGCTSGATVRVTSLGEMLLNEVPGGLPDNATELEFSVENADFTLSLFGGFVNCRYAGEQPATLSTTDTGTNTYRSGLITIEPTPLAKVSGLGCPASGEMTGTMSLEAQSITVS